ncbi:hypothetical protein VPIG_00008 [Vibrio phage PWH3a-P1]|uniref:hypothetical protein n=1 Tax=Vibrio phage PWH3a-P1 TaxID=754058 RepID=UPI0002C08AC5|nr:hypothetical protein VPIG_00008 [Vibrio phage PWH3a-P1]AGH31866.1 hypothetical protein VPIG_00008 [Vibrio phage PWH3a-P1]
MTDIPNANRIHYIHRDTTYSILHHSVMVKVSSSWKEGCVYQDESSQVIYVRPYEAFDVNKWRIIG